MGEAMKTIESDGSTASYYELPAGATELQHLISHRDMNAQIGEIFRACYRYGLVAHSPRVRDIKKILFYAQAELERLQKLELQPAPEARPDDSHLERAALRAGLLAVADSIGPACVKGMREAMSAARDDARKDKGNA